MVYIFRKGKFELFDLMETVVIDFECDSSRILWIKFRF